MCCMLMCSSNWVSNVEQVRRDRSTIVFDRILGNMFSICPWFFGHDLSCFPQINVNLRQILAISNVDQVGLATALRAATH